MTPSADEVDLIHREQCVADRETVAARNDARRRPGTPPPISATSTSSAGRPASPPRSRIWPAEPTGEDTRDRRLDRRTTELAERGAQAGLREQAADERDQAADKRDRVADQREQVADQREIDAELRREDEQKPRPPVSGSD